MTSRNCSGSLPVCDGSRLKPVGLVCISVAGVGGRLTRSMNLPGGRADVRDRSTTVAMHLVRRLLAPAAPGGDARSSAPCTPRASRAAPRAS